MITKEIVLTLVDQFLAEITIMINDDDDCTMTVSQLVEVYVTTFFLRSNNEIKNAVDFHELDDLVWNMRADFKAKDTFNILEEHAKGSL